MPFELYSRRPGRRDPAQPSATIQKGGYLTISEAAYQALGEPGAVELLYNKDQKAIGLRISEGPHAYPIQKHPTGRSYRVSSTRSFMQHYGIPTNKARRYPAEYNGRQKMLVIDLSGPGESVIRGGIAAEADDPG